MPLESILANNPLCKLLGIRYPVLQAGMYQVAYGGLAAAVSAAGGLGVIGAAFMTPEALREEIHTVRRATEMPFGVDILFARVEGKDAGSAGYSEQVREHIEVVFEEQVPVLVSGLGNPGEIVPRARQAGMVVMSAIGNVRHALRVAEAGVDAVIASGHDGGGHVGRVGTIALVPAVVDALAKGGANGTVDALRGRGAEGQRIPVVAAGGLADGRGLVAALALGAAGVWMGTRFIATHQARGHINYKNKLVEIGDEGTVVSRANSGKPNRMVRNRFTESWEGREDEILPYPRQMLEVGAPASILGRIEGDVDNGVLPSGLSAALIHEVMDAGDVVRTIMEEAERILREWGT